MISLPAAVPTLEPAWPPTWLRLNVVGMAWYRRDTFDRVRGMMLDADALPATYDEFLASAEERRGAAPPRRLCHDPSAPRSG